MGASEKNSVLSKPADLFLFSYKNTTLLTTLSKNRNSFFIKIKKSHGKIQKKSWKNSWWVLDIKKPEKTRRAWYFILK